MLRTDFLRKSFTVSQLKALDRVAEIHLEFISRLKEFYSHKVQTRKKILLLDYQCIASYAFPFARPNLDTGEWLNYVSFRYLLEFASPRSIVIPEGTFFEILRALETFAQPKRNSFQFLEKVSRLEANSGFSFRGLLRDWQTGDLGVLQFGLPAKELAIQASSSIAEISSAAKRFELLLGKESIVSLSELPFSKDLESTDASLMSMNEVYKDLSNQRRGKGGRNAADAINFAWTHTIREAAGTLGVHPFLVTDTDALKLSGKRFAERNEKESYIWSPATAVYSTILDREEPDKQHTWLADAEAVCLEMQKRIGDIQIDVSSKTRPTYSQDLQFVLSWDEAEASQKLGPFYDYALGPLMTIFQRFEALYRENIANNLDKLSESRKEQRELEKSDLSFDDEIGLRIEKAKCRIRKIAKVARDRAHIWKMIESRKELGIEDFYDISSHELEGKETVHLERRDKNKKSLALTIENFDGFSSIYWKTTLPLTKVMSILNETLMRLDIDSKLAGVSKARRRKTMVVYLLNQGRQEISSTRKSFTIRKIPISLADFVRIDVDKMVDFVRINTEFADFCYHTRPVSGDEQLYPEFGRLFGLLVKSDLSEVTADLFTRTGTESVDKEWVRKFISAYSIPLQREAGS